MLRHAGIESVGGETILALEKFEPGSRYKQPEITRLAADRAIALRHEDILGRHDLEAHAPAMTSPAILDHLIAPGNSKT
jgi:hypothetical protein